MFWFLGYLKTGLEEPYRMLNLLKVLIYADKHTNIIRLFNILNTNSSCRAKERESGKNVKWKIVKLLGCSIFFPLKCKTLAWKWILKSTILIPLTLFIVRYSTLNLKRNHLLVMWLQSFGEWCDLLLGTWRVFFVQLFCGTTCAGWVQWGALFALRWQEEVLQLLRADCYTLWRQPTLQLLQSTAEVKKTKCYRVPQFGTARLDTTDR